MGSVRPGGVWFSAGGLETNHHWVLKGSAGGFGGGFWTGAIGAGGGGMWAWAIVVVSRPAAKVVRESAAAADASWVQRMMRSVCEALWARAAAVVVKAWPAAAAWAAAMLFCAREAGAREAACVCKVEARVAEEAADCDL